MNTRGFIRFALFATAAALAAGLGVPAWAQPADVTTGRAVYHDTSPRLDHMPPANPGKSGENRPIPNNPRAMPPRFPDLTEPDGGVQLQAAEPSQLGPTPGTLVSAPGLSADDDGRILGYRVVPPDVNGDIGLDASGNRIFIQYINSIWGVFNANGVLIAGPYKGNTFWQGFEGFCQTNNDGDPVVLYDDQAGRWVFSQFSIDEGVQCMAISTTSDPLGPYHRYAFTVSPGKKNDYPKLGVWTDGAGQSAYTFTVRDFPYSSSGFMGTGVMERAKMLVGASAQFIKFVNPCTATNCIEGQLPAHLAGSPPPAGTCPTFWTAVDAATDGSPYSSDGYRNHRLCVDWSNLSNSTYTEGSFVVAGSNFDRALGNINPVNGGEQLNSLPYFTMYRAQYRWFGSYGSVLLNTTVDAGSERAGIRWAEVRSNSGDSAWYRYQDGTFAPDDGLERWMGSIAQDQDGNIALGYTVAGSSLFPSVRYATRMAGDALGTLAGGEASCVEGTGAQAANSYNRWGDYSSMSVDPTDDCTFWYTQEYYETTGAFDWNTRICSFQIPGCGGTPFNYPPQVTITDPADGSDFEAGASVTFVASAVDTEDGDLGGNVNWTIDGSSAASGPTFSTSSLAVGSHQVSASVTDSGGKSGSDAIQVTIVGVPTDVHVASVTIGTLSAARGAKYGTATVTVVTDLGQPAAAYVVSGQFGGSFNETATGSTDASGQVTLTTATALKGPTVTFCVSNVTGPAGSLPYAPGDNAAGVDACAAPPNQPPVVTITAPADGATFAPGTTITFTGTANDPEQGDLSGSLVWTADGNPLGTGASFSTSTLGTGTHAIVASVTDNKSLTGSDSISVTVGTPPGGVTMHVGDLDGSGTPGRTGRWDANVTVTVHDAADATVSGATVNGSWSNGANGTGSCVTDGSGRCDIAKTNNKTNVSPVTFTVTGISRNAADTYASGANHDPDGPSDSNGTTINIAAP